MNTMIRGSTGGALAAAFVLAAMLATPAAAQERLHQINWAHSEPETVSYFIVLVSDVEGRVEGAREINVGRPTGQAAGSFTIFSAVVAFEPDEFLAVRAVGHDGLLSAASDWGSMPPTRPGQPLLAD
ncbi:MAG: hypothetical protein AAGC67_18895 [Myxococcota bacterium]